MNRMTAVASLIVVISNGPAVGQEDPQQFPTDPYRITSQSLVEGFGKPLAAAAADAARPLIPLARDLIKSFEGWSATPYNDPANYCTIGYGHLIALRPCNEVDLSQVQADFTKSEGEALLEIDTRSARLAVQNLVTVELTSEQFGALSSFVFNVGESKFSGSTMLRLLNSGDFDLAAGQLSRWVRAKDTILPGLVARRACEETLFRGELAYDEYGHFNRDKCVSLGAAPTAGPLIDIEIGE